MLSLLGTLWSKAGSRGELLEQALLASGKEMKGTVVFQTLPFVHPNAETREKGFREVFAKYPDVEIVELTGISPEEHFNAFDGAIKAYPDMIGAWGLYSSATIGMLNAKKSNGKDDLLLSSVDNDKPILAAIYNGEIVGTGSLLLYRAGEMDDDPDRQPAQRRRQSRASFSTKTWQSQRTTWKRPSSTTIQDRPWKAICLESRQ